MLPSAQRRSLSNGCDAHSTLQCGVNGLKRRHSSQEEDCSISKRSREVAEIGEDLSACSPKMSTVSPRPSPGRIALAPKANQPRKLVIKNFSGSYMFSKFAF